MSAENGGDALSRQREAEEKLKGGRWMAEPLCNVSKKEVAEKGRHFLVWEAEREVDGSLAVKTSSSSLSLSLSCRHWGRESCQVQVLMKLFDAESNFQNLRNKRLTIIGLYLVLEIACYVSQFQIMPYLFEIAFRRWSWGNPLSPHGMVMVRSLLG